ncbi:hypothetical protein VNO77_44344 [Canavalia gladiata]|uniref:Uncharacterized protein n=1 Tax=Canavalia gladiata TaxID=3824 RepID=A0AAN9JVS8_CANGL
MKVLRRENVEGTIQKERPVSKEVFSDSSPLGILGDSSCPSMGDKRRSECPFQLRISNTMPRYENPIPYFSIVDPLRTNEGRCRVIGREAVFTCGCSTVECVPRGINEVSMRNGSRLIFAANISIEWEAQYFTTRSAVHKSSIDWTVQLSWTQQAQKGDTVKLKDQQKLNTLSLDAGFHTRLLPGALPFFIFT